MSRARLVELALLALIILAAAVLRGRDLDRFIASDELRWTCRSVNFDTALREGALARTYQVGHPGVITLWLGSRALPDDLGDWRRLCRETDGGEDLSDLDDVGMEGVLQTVRPLLFAARRGVAAGSLLALAALYLLLRGWIGVGPWPALGGLALLALDPFLLAHSRVLHLDAMVSLLALLAVVALEPEGGSDGADGLRHLGAGALTGLAVLAKSSALALVPFALGWYGWRAWRAGAAVGVPPSQRLRRALIGLAPVALGAAATFALLWPAMWAAPIDTVARMLAKAAAEGGVPHPSGNYFLGQPTADPGPLFYPVVVLLRSTPLTLLGLAAAALWLLAPVRLARSNAVVGPPERRLVARLVAWAVVFGVLVTLGPKKFDRYLLPALVALQLAGGLAIVGWLGRALAGRTRVALTGAAVAVLALAQGALAVSAHPYYLAWYFPSTALAERVLLVGWGEGYDLAADYLNALPEPEALEASVRGVSNFAPLFAGRTRSAPGYEPRSTDYVVLYKSQVQRRQNEALLAAYHDDPAVEPAFIGRLNGVAYVWVYPNKTTAPLSAAVDARAAPRDVLVVGGETPFARRYDGRRPIVRYWGHWGQPEMREALDEAFPAGWQRAWVVRYPGYDPPVALDVLAEVAERGPTVRLLDGVIELTPFTRGSRP